MVYERRFRKVLITGEALVSLFTEGEHPSYRVIPECALPEDANFVGARYDSMLGCLEIYVWSSEWPILLEGATPPQHPTIWTESVRHDPPA